MTFPFFAFLSFIHKMSQKHIQYMSQHFVCLTKEINFRLWLLPGKIISFLIYSNRQFVATTHVFFVVLLLLITFIPSKKKPINTLQMDCKPIGRKSINMDRTNKHKQFIIYPSFFMRMYTIIPFQPFFPSSTVFRKINYKQIDH